MPTVTLRVRRIIDEPVRDPLSGYEIPQDQFVEVTYHREIMAMVNEGVLEREVREPTVVAIDQAPAESPTPKKGAGKASAA